MTTSEECARCRELASAALDGPLAGADRASLDGHLRACGGCRAWQEQALFLRRTLAVSRLDPPAALTRSVVASLGAARARAARWVLVVRAALVAVAMTGLVLALPALVWGQDDGLEMHASHELGSTDVALCVGLLAAALWPRRARGVLTVLGAAAALLVVTAAGDIAVGRTTLGHEAPHAVAVAGALLVWTLARLVPEQAPPVLLPAAAVDAPANEDEVVDDSLSTG